ncbi:MAG: tetratricopeptide repeat protein [Candidatus Hydrogenedentes bacterium]|nr:tetratricopeptide repeat protein [Candidatus Hydrogenedentota bacterium]
MATLNFAQSLIHAGHYEQALRELESCGEVTPEVELNKGLCYAALGRMSRARHVLDGLRLSGFDRHADRLAARLAEDAPVPEIPPPAPPTRHRRMAWMYAGFAALGALLLLEGVYVGAGLVTQNDYKLGTRATIQNKAVVPQPVAVTRQQSATANGATEFRVISLGFDVDTTSLLGHWSTVDFVSNIDDFRPGERQSTLDFFVRELSFFDHGTMSMNGERSSFAWEPGWITEIAARVKCQYAVRTQDGGTYLFLPWLNGDVVNGGMAPKFYVLKKIQN